MKRLSKVSAAVLAACVFLVTDSYAAQSIDAVNITVTEEETVPGKPCRISLSAGYSLRYGLEAVSFSPGYEDWTEGGSVDVCVVLRAKEGYEFTAGTSYRNYYMELTGHSGDNVTQTVHYRYSPVIRQAAPGNAYYEDETTVSWEKTEGARRYLVKIYEDDELVKVIDTKKRSVDLSGYGTDGETVSCRIFALSSNVHDDSVISSWYAEPEEGYIGESTVYGSFRRSAGGRYFVTDGGTKAYGWQFINGHWYYFDTDRGYAVENSWFQDSDGCWYHFGKEGKMTTGRLFDDGHYYRLGTGQDPEQGKPYGAMVTGWYSEGPGGNTVFYNDGSIPGIPLGAEITE